MDYINLIGIIAAILTTSANIPQTYKIIKEKNTDGVSTYTYTILLIGTTLWVIYGLLNNDLPVIVANAITAVTCIIILTLNFTSRKVINRIHEAVIPKEIKKKASRNNSGK